MDFFSVVTGAGSGIGRSVALLLADRGHDVVLVGRAQAPLDEVALEVRERGRHARAIACDVSSAADVERLGRAVATFGAPRVVVHSAGVILRGLVSEMSAHDWDLVIGTNLNGVFYVSHALLGAMLAAKRGRIIAIGSISSTLGTARASAYCASKWGVVGFVKSLAEELRGTGLQAMCVMPGSVDTPMLVGSGYAPEMTADEVANLVVYAALDAPDAMNGSAIEMFGR